MTCMYACRGFQHSCVQRPMDATAMLTDAKICSMLRMPEVRRLFVRFLPLESAPFATSQVRRRTTENWNRPGSVAFFPLEHSAETYAYREAIRARGHDVVMRGVVDTHPAANTEFMSVKWCKGVVQLNNPIDTAKTEKKWQIIDMLEKDTTLRNTS